MKVDIVPVYCNRVYVMQSGGIVKQGTPAEVFADPGKIRQAYLRLPRVAHLWEILRKKEGLELAGNPLTVREARPFFRAAMEVKENDRSIGSNGGGPGD